MEMLMVQGHDLTDSDRTLRRIDVPFSHSASGNHFFSAVMDANYYLDPEKPQHRRWQPSHSKGVSVSIFC